MQVFAPAGTDGLGRTGAGYLIGDGLVLTARHVIEQASGPCEVRVVGDTDWAATSVVWCGEGDDDAALLRVDAPIDDVGRAWLGRLAGDDRVACASTGFPWAQLRRRDGGPLRRTEHLVGEIDRLTGQEPGIAPWLLTIHVAGSVPEPRDGGSPWAGMSGAGLECAGLLVGVVIVDPARFGTDRLLALPLTRLVAAPGFVQALRAARGAPVVLETVEAQGVLERAYEPAPRTRARQSSSFLLGAQYGVVAFRSRRELDELREWARGGQDADVAILTGAGGVGKSRLARELCAGLAAQGWVAGLLAHDPPTEQVSRLTHVGGPVLVVVDYAETRAGNVVALLQRLARSGASRRPRRLLLIARQLGDWWIQLRARATDGEVRELLNCASTIEIGTAAHSVEDRENAYREAIAAFAGHTGQAPPDPPAFDLSDHLFDTLLFIHMAALGAVPGGADTPITRAGSIRADLLARTLEREARYWSDSANALDPPLAIDEHVRRRAVTVATLTTPTTTGAPAGEDETAALLEAVPDLRDDAALRRRVGRWLHGLYSASGGWIGPLEPDLLGESLVAQTTTVAPQLVRDLLGRADAATASRALTVLTRGSRHHDACRGALADALDSHLHQLAGAAVDVAQQLGDPIGTLLADALARQPDSVLARDVLRAVPPNTVSLREAAAIAAAQALEGVPADSRERAGLLVDQSTRLSDLGRLEDALTASEEAVAMYFRVAEAGPGVSQRDFAVSITEKSERFRALGRREDALAAIQEVVDLFRRLAEARPTAFLPDHATTLNTHSRRLSELGRREEALTAIEQAVAISRRPDAPLEDLGLSLNSQSNILQSLGRGEEALAAIDEAVATYRRLADTRPDAYLPDLAASLSNQSARLRDLKRHDDAFTAIEEAVAIRRRLADTRPDAFLPDLAASLHYQSAIFRDLERYDDAFTAIEEAVAVRRQLADARPGAFLHDLAASLSTQSAMFRDLGRHDDALTTIEEAVAIDRRLAAERPGAFLPNLSTALNNQAAMLRDLGRHEEAVAAIAEAVAIHQRLAAARPDAFLPELSTTLHNQSTMLLDLGRYEDAYNANEEALRIVLPMLERAHYILPDAGASLLQNYLHRCEDTGRRPDLQVVLRMRAVLVSAGLISGD